LPYLQARTGGKGRGYVRVDETRLKFDAYQEYEEAYGHQVVANSRVIDEDVFALHWYPRWERLAAFMEEAFPGFEYRTGDLARDQDVAAAWCWTGSGWYFLGEAYTIFVTPEWPRDSFDTFGEDEVHLLFRYTPTVGSRREPFYFEGTVSGGLPALEQLLSRFLWEPTEEESGIPEVFHLLNADAPVEKGVIVDAYWALYKRLVQRLYPDD
jgi:hypothetical protein